MKTTTRKKRVSKLKAYRFDYPTPGSYFVAAANEPQAIGTLMAHLEEDDAKEVGSCVEVNPAEVEVNFEQNDGSYQKGSLAEIMPDHDPEVVLDSDYS